MNAELIKALKEDAEWAHANEWETPITLGDHLDAAVNALESLQAQLAQSQRREQAAVEDAKQERERGCEYCADCEDLAFGHDSMKRVGSIYIDGNLLVADLYSESMAVAVRFCPMCGKSLKEVAND
jgi:membrane protease subunit (stomatin/prohibitin family)